MEYEFTTTIIPISIEYMSIIDIGNIMKINTYTYNAISKLFKRNYDPGNRKHHKNFMSLLLNGKVRYTVEYYSGNKYKEMWWDNNEPIYWKKYIPINVSESSNKYICKRTKKLVYTYNYKEKNYTRNYIYNTNNSIIDKLRNKCNYENTFIKKVSNDTDSIEVEPFYKETLIDISNGFYIYSFDIFNNLPYEEQVIDIIHKPDELLHDLRDEDEIDEDEISSDEDDLDKEMKELDNLLEETPILEVDDNESI